MVQKATASKSLRPPKPPKIGRTRLLPPPKPPALIADVNGRREWQRLRSVQEQQPLDDRGALGRQLRPAQEAQGDQLADGNRVGHQWVRNNIGVRWVKADRWIEVQELAEPRRVGQKLGLDLLDVGLAALQLGGGTVGVGISALPGHGVIRGQPGNRPCLVESLEGHGASPFRPEQFTESQRHLQEDLVADRDVVELALSHELAAFEVTEDYHGRVATEEDARDVDGSRGHRVSAGPDVDGASVHREDVAVGLLEIAAVGVIVHARVDRGQKPGRRKLANGRGLKNPLPGRVQFRVLHAGQPQRRIEVDRLNLGTQDRWRRYRHRQSNPPVGFFLFPTPVPGFMRR